MLGLDFSPQMRATNPGSYEVDFPAMGSGALTQYNRKAPPHCPVRQFRESHPGAYDIGRKVFASRKPIYGEPCDCVKVTVYRR